MEKSLKVRQGALHCLFFSSVFNLFSARAFQLRLLLKSIIISNAEDVSAESVRSSLAIRLLCLEMRKLLWI